MFLKFGLSLKARRILRAFLLLTVTFVFQFFFLLKPSYGFLSSVDSCASQAACSSALASELGIAQNAIKPFARSTAKAITVTATNATTGAKASTLVQSVGGLTVGAAAGTLGYLSADKIESL